ncbi:MAG: response regulator, partial [Bdellovibrionales bacterium]|nr:response regulator [Bdellovibrionales bacterium]
RSRQGFGTCFTVQIPLIIQEKVRPAPGEELPEVEPSEREMLKVLVVEDNKVNQMILQKILESWGQSVELADSGVEALERCKAQDFDIILMDIQMPEMDGLEATRRIREFQRGKGKPYVPVIAVTANAFSEEKERYKEAGMDGYVSKPLSKKELNDEIVRCVSPTRILGV